MTTGLRERKKQETRNALSAAAVRLVIERGYDAVRIEDIAEEADFSPRTFNNYFASKAEAFTARYLDRLLLVADELGHRPAKEPLWTAIQAALDAHIAMGVEGAETTTPTRQWLEGVRLTVTEPALRGQMYRANGVALAALAAAIAERTGTDPCRDVYPKLAAAVFTTGLTVAVEHWSQADPPVAFGPVLRTVLDQVGAGLPEPSTKHQRSGEGEP
jgi:AcrR family transcriptional regulator